MRRSTRSPSLAEFVEDIVQNRKGAKTPISTLRMVEEIRRRFPDCEHTDKELADIVATLAIVAGVAIAFDQIADGEHGRPDSLFERRR